MPDLFAESAPPAPEGDGRPRVLSVTEITRTVRDLVEGMVGEVWVEGEVCNHRKQASGHQYFTLKDDRCQLPCVLFHRPGLRHASLPLADGMLVHARGMMTVYEARGQYQLNVSHLQAAGAGALAARFEALKRKLAAEGLFDPARKRPLPRFPSAVGIVTSPTGAAVRDMIQILHRRAPWVRIVIHPVRVQGSGAAAEIAAAVAEFNSGALPPVEVIVVARGGGSAEDLWEFNEEAVARAIAASALPVVSAVGHEIDFSISDFVADLRAPTPSAAAELIAPDSAELLRHFARAASLLERTARETLERERMRLDFAGRSALFREPRARLEEAMQALDLTAAGLERGVGDRLAAHRQRLEALAAPLREHRPDQLLVLRRHELAAAADRLRRAAAQQLDTAGRRRDQAESLLRVLGPQATLARGFSITRRAGGEIVYSVAQTPPGEELVTQLADGTVRSRVEAEAEAAH